MWVVFHGLTDDIGHLVKAAIIHFSQSMHQSPLNRFQAIIQAWYCPLKDDIASIVQEVGLKHAPNPRFHRNRRKQFTLISMAVHGLIQGLITHRLCPFQQPNCR